MSALPPWMDQEHLRRRHEDAKLTVLRTMVAKVAQWLSLPKDWDKLDLAGLVAALNDPNLEEKTIGSPYWQALGLVLNWIASDDAAWRERMACLEIVRAATTDSVTAEPGKVKAERLILQRCSDRRFS